MKQLNLNLDKGKLGGRRKGAGRRRIHSKGVSHRAREKVSHRAPLHINFKYKTQIRNKDSLRLLKRAILNARKHGLRISYFSLQSNHVHLIAEAPNNQILTKGMRSLTVTMAMGLKKGRIQLERYHLHVLKSLRETKNAIEYVCFNKQKHENKKRSTLDDYSSIPESSIIRNFVRRSGVILTLTSRENWRGDPPLSFLLARSLLL